MELNLDINKLNNAEDIITKLKGEIDELVFKKLSLNEDNCAIIEIQDLIIIKNCNKTISEIILKGKLKFSDFTQTSLLYEEFVYIGDFIELIVFNEEEIVSCLKQFVNQLNKKEENKNLKLLITVKLNGIFIYKRNNVEILNVKKDQSCEEEKLHEINDNKQIENKNSININNNNEYKDKKHYQSFLLLIAVKLYATYFFNFKLKPESSFYILSENQTEKKIMELIFIDLNNYLVCENESNNFIDDNPSIVIPKQHSVDLLLDFSKSNFNNETKKYIFSIMDSNSIIYTSSTNFQLDPTDIQYLSNENILLTFSSITNFFSNFTYLGKILNFLDDFFEKIVNYNSYNKIVNLLVASSIKTCFTSFSDKYLELKNKDKMPSEEEFKNFKSEEIYNKIIDIVLSETNDSELVNKNSNYIVISNFS